MLTILDNLLPFVHNERRRLLKYIKTDDNYSSNMSEIKLYLRELSLRTRLYDKIHAISPIKVLHSP